VLDELEAVEADVVVDILGLSTKVLIAVALPNAC
jgi:hypothetical protein